MGRRSAKVGIALILIFVLQVCHAIEQCRTGCSEGPGLLKLTPGTTYKYDYDGKITTLLSSAEDQQTTTEVKATVLLTQQVDCSQILRLQNVQIIGPDGKKRSGVPNIEKPVILNNNNGELQDIICTEEGDTQDSLNLKRAIASFFQVNTNKTSEIDVFGQCPVQISETQNGDITTVTKNKNLNKCAFRESLKNSYLTATFDIHSDLQSNPVLNSALDSKQQIKAGVLESASIVENYLFVPFSVGQNGLKATVESKLTHSGTSNDIPSTKSSIPKSIIFENPHPTHSPHGNVNTILTKVKELSQELGAVIEDKTAIHFLSLIEILRMSKKPDILTVYNQIRSGVGFSNPSAIKALFLDAVLASGTGDAIETAIELLKNKELNPGREKQLYVGLARARHVSENSIKTATELLNRPNLPREAYLAIGALAGRYCAEHKCENVEVVNKIIQKLLSKLGDLKAANRKEENDMIFVLKGLTNIGFLNDAILSKLVSLAEDKKQPTRLRVATLQAFLAAPCKDKLRDSALKTLKDIQQDSEIRINAYLVLTECPNDKIGKAVKALLDHEKSHQVGRFITSHIRNIRSSANPDKQLAKTHLGFIHTPNKFQFDPRKFSFNTEFSFSAESVGVANSVEANVIYSQDSWLPRSANLNLTAEIFGHRVNLLEIGTRQENLEKVVEHYIGPQGILRKATLQQKWDHVAKPIANLFKGLKGKVEKSLKAKRDVSNAEIEELNKKVQTKTNELDKNLDLDLSIKTLGSEVIFMNSFDMTQKLTPQSIVDKLVAKLNHGIDNLKNFEDVIHCNNLLHDGELSYPTSLGFPLKLILLAASNIQVKLAGNIDLRELVSKGVHNDITLKLSIVPSAAVTVSGVFSLDTPLLESGLKTVSTLHTSSGGDLTLELFNKGEGIDVKFKVPVHKQELVGLKHKILFFTKENGLTVKRQNLKFAQNKDLSICVDQLKTIIGLELCSDLNGPNLSGKKVPILPFPFSGDAKVSVRLERGDIDTFHFRGEKILADGKIGAQASLETFGSNNNKGLAINVEGFIAPEKYIKATLKSPIKNGDAEARLIVNEKEKLLKFSLHDENRPYAARIGIEIADEKDGTVYKPVVEYTTPETKTPQTPPVHLDGKVITKRSGNDVKYTLDNIKLVVPNKPTVTLTGNFGTEGAAHVLDLTVTEGSFSVTTKGRVEKGPSDLKIDAEFQNSIEPNLNFKFIGEFQKHENPRHVAANIQLTHGPDLNSKTNILTLSHSSTLKSAKPLEYSTQNKFSYPLIQIEGKLNFNRAPKIVDYDTYIQYSDIKLGSKMDLKCNTKSVGDLQMDLDLHSTKDKIELKLNRQVLTPYESKINHALGINGKKIEIAGKVKHSLDANDFNIAADVSIKTPNIKTPLKLNQGLRINHGLLNSHLLIASGKTPLVDSLLNVNRQGDILGHIKVTLKDVLSVAGELKAEKGVGSVAFVVHAVPAKKSAQLEGTFTVQSHTLDLDLTLYPLYNEDKNKKIVLLTKNHWGDSKLNSTTTLDILSSQFIWNVKSELGSPTNGKTNIEVDFTLPDKQYLTATFARDVSIQDSLVNTDSQLSLEQRKNKATPGRKADFKLILKDTNIRKGIIDATASLAASCAQGGNINVDVDLKRRNDGDKQSLQFNQKIATSLLKNPIELSYDAELTKATGSIKLRGSVDPKANAQVQVNFDVQPKQISGALTTNIALPFKILSHIKTSHAVEAKTPQGTNPQVSLLLSGSVQTTSSNPKLNADIKTTIKAQGNKKTGSASIHRVVNKPFKASLDATANYNIDPAKKTGTVSGNLKAVFPENKVVQGSLKLARPSAKEYDLEASLNLPTNSFKTNKLVVQTKREDDQNGVISKVDLTTDGKRYVVDTDLGFKYREPHFEVKLTYPDGKVSDWAASIKTPSDNTFIGKIKVLRERSDFLLEGGLNIEAENLKNFNTQMTINSPKLNLKDVVIKLGNSEGNNGNTINVIVTSEGKNVISGSTTVSSREEQGKFIVEGSGDFKVKDVAKTGNFKFIKTHLASDKNGEIGEQISINAALGNKAIDVEFKATNKELRISCSSCEESKQCAHVEVNAKAISNDVKNFETLVEVNIDLRVLGIPNEFGLKSVTHRQNWIIDHTMDIHFENNANKYQFSVNLHPKQIGVSLTTPNRIIALEGNYVLPTTNIRNGGKASGELVFYTDKKNNPSSKSALTGAVNIDVQSRAIDAEVKLNIVQLSKPLVVTYNHKVPKQGTLYSSAEELVLDVFTEEAKKIILSRSVVYEVNKDTYGTRDEQIIIVKSPGLAVDLLINTTGYLEPKALSGGYIDSMDLSLGSNKYNTIVKLEKSPNQIIVLIEHLNVVLLDMISDISLQKGLLNIKTHMSGVGMKNLESELDIKDYKSFSLTRYFKEDPNKKVIISAAINPGDKAEARADIQTGTTKKELFHASLSLAEKNFLHPDLDIQKENVKEFVSETKQLMATRVSEMAKAVGEKGESLNNDLKKLGEGIKESIPRSPGTQQFYESELNKFRDELTNDKTLQDLAEVLRNGIHAAVTLVSNAINSISQVVEKIAATLNSLFADTIESIKKDILPKIKELAKKVTSLATDIIDQATDAVLVLAAKAMEVVKSIQPQLKAVAQIFSEIFGDVAKFLIDAYNSIKVSVQQQLKHLENEIKSSQVVKNLKAKYGNIMKNVLPSRGDVLNTIKIILGSLKDAIPFPQVQKTISLIEAYLDKKINRQKVDDVEEIKKIISSVLETLTKLTATISQDLVPDLLRGTKIPGINWDLLKRLPSIGAVRFSPLEQLLHEERSPYVDLLIRLLVTPQNLILPHRMRAAILAGELYTFDGKHIHLDAHKCSYLLARDAVNGNFSMIITFEDKALSSVTLHDKSGSITVKKDKILLDNVEVDYPIKKGTLEAIYKIDHLIISTEMGAEFICALDMIACEVSISGFYHGSLRGILGDGNHEGYDDFTLPNGKIVSNAKELLAAYVVGSNTECKNVPVEDVVSHKSDPGCEKLFSWASHAKWCYPIVDSQKYKRGCERAVASGIKEAHSLFAICYMYMCRKSNVIIDMPSEYSRPCSNSETPHTVDEEFEISVPAKKADVVFTINTNKNSEQFYKEFIQPLFGEIVKEYKANQIEDVQLSVIAYGGEIDKSSIVTVKGLRDVTARGPNIKFSEPAKPEKLITGWTDLDKTIATILPIINHMKRMLGFSSIGEAYYDTTEYPFRAEAIKSTVYVGNEACNVNSNLPMQLLMKLEAYLYRKDIQITVINPVDELKVKDAEKTKDVIGFNHENVITLSDITAKPLGSPELMKELSHNSACADYGMAAGANMFVYNNIEANKASKQQILAAMAKNIVGSSLQKKMKVVCTCGYTYRSPFYPYNRCKPVDL